MSPAPNRFLHADSGGAFRIPPIPTRMDFFALQDRFWQLEAEQPFPPAAAKFYFYWLNRFNAARWPTSLRRFTKQVAADLTMDEKTVSKMAATLQERGLLRYTAGTRVQSAIWEISTSDALFTNDDRKNSGRQTAPTSRVDRKNSGQVAEFGPRTSHDDRKNSGAYKEEEKNSSVVEEKEEEGAAAAGPLTSKKKEGAESNSISALAPESPNASASHTRGAAPALLFPAWATDTFRTEWAEWLAHRQSKRDKLKPLSQQKLLDKLASFDEGFCHLLFDKAISNGYTGLVFDDTPAKYEVYKRNQSTPYDPTGHGNYSRAGHKAESLSDLGATVDQYFENKYGN